MLARRLLHVMLCYAMLFMFMLMLMLMFTVPVGSTVTPMKDTSSVI